MAKTRKATAASPSTSSESGVPDSKLEEFAEDLGHLLGTTQAKATAWLEQRRQVLEHLTKLRDAAITTSSNSEGEWPGRVVVAPGV